MVDISPSYEPRKLHVDGRGRTESIPDGEIWKARIILKQGQNRHAEFLIDGVILQDGIQHDTSGTASASTVLVGGTKIHVNKDCRAFISGYDITTGPNPIENEPINVLRDGNKDKEVSVTVPSGETWDVTLMWKAIHKGVTSGAIKIDGCKIQSARSYSDTNLFVTSAVLPAGTTINADTSFHVGGFKV